MESINYKYLDNYEYFESDKEYYYISPIKIIIDNKKNILMNSNISLRQKEYLEMSTKYLNNIDLTTSNCDSYHNVIFIQNWFDTYGHFKDELFNLYNFYKLFNNKEFTVFMNYKKTPHIGYSFENYNKLSNLLFESKNFINVAELNNNNIIKINHLILINHDLNSPMFHMFPSTNKILSKINHCDNNVNKNIFITRGKALHLPRNLDNQEELEQYFLTINYSIINPEIIDIELFINQIKNAENIYITWGGAMVNLCYVNPNANIYLLQSLSYKHEDLFHIFKFLRNYKNLYLIKCNDDNKIDINFENKIKLN
jgi:hypothetical protein